MQPILVSVIIPCYNGELFVDRALRSIFEQNYDKIEVIVVDDGSTDGSKEKIIAWEKSFEAKHNGLKYIYQQNQGLGGAINTGLKYVKGEYLALLDADDEYLPGAVSEKANYLDNHPEVDIVRCNGYEINGETKHLFEFNHKTEMDDNFFYELVAGTSYNWAGSYMVRTKALFSFYPDREIYTSRFGQNLQFLMPLSFHKPVGYIDAPHMNYIRQQESLSKAIDFCDRKKKEIDNQYGYTDIRVHMVQSIVKDPGERKKYLNIVESGHYRSLMRIAICYKDKEIIQEVMNGLKKLSAFTIEDKIICYSLIFPVYSIVLRVFRKLNNYMNGK